MSEEQSSLQNTTNNESPDQLMELILAVEDGDVRKVKSILESQSELAQQVTVQSSSDHYRQPGATALHYAAWVGQQEAARILLEYGADINLKDGTYNDTPLGWANEIRQYAMIDFLISHGAAMNIGDAARTGKVGLVEAFIHLDPALVNLGRDTGWTPLYSASGWGHGEVVKLLLDSGADINAPSLHGNAALHAAATEGQIDTLSILLTRGAEPDARTKDGTTPLHRAAWRRRKSAVELLLSSGASPDITEMNGHTALDLASAEKGVQVTGWGEANTRDPYIMNILSKDRN